MEQLSGKVAVVTGASSGIGAAIAEALVKKGMIVAGFARRKGRILELAKSLENFPGKLHAVECDVAEEENILKAFLWVEDNLGGLNVLINNAGVVRGATLSDGATEEWRRTFDVNVLGLCICTREALKLMRKNPGELQGHIININSLAGHRIPDIIPGLLNVYPASKFAVRAISETLRKELIHDDRKIKVTNLSPGTVATEMMKTNDIKLKKEEMAELMKHTVALRSQDIAEAVLYVLGTPPHVQVTELTIQPLGERL